MGMNAVYRGPGDCPGTLPLFPLPGALLLPRGQMPLNIFEPRYLAMIDDAIRGARMIGMIQPDAEAAASGPPSLYAVGCAGRITQFAESGDGRVLVTLTGVSRFRVQQEVAGDGPYRRALVDYGEFAADFVMRAGEDDVDRDAVIAALERFVAANDLEIEWKGIEDAPNEALVNALAMMSPFGVREKQALLEAPDLKARAEALVAITEFELASESSGTDVTPLH